MIVEYRDEIRIELIKAEFLFFSKTIIELSVIIHHYFVYYLPYKYHNDANSQYTHKNIEQTKIFLAILSN